VNAALEDAVGEGDRNPAGRLANQYDEIATLYQRSRNSPIRRYVEAYTFLGLLGEVRGRTVLDLACGEGFYTRLLRAHGAARVVGVDISAKMIDLARRQERERPMGVEYAVGDVRQLQSLGSFDIVVAGYLLHYARNRDELRAMCRAIGRQLPAGGRFVTINENPEQPADRYRGYARYGFSKATVAPRGEGSPITYTMIAGRELFQFEISHFGRDTYEQALTDAGFAQISWHAPALDPAGLALRGAEYWREYLENPPIAGLVCRRGG
jgi:ubiquinone/menaquinone biosynthesis C-methylase UbiE